MSIDPKITEDRASVEPDLAIYLNKIQLLKKNDFTFISLSKPTVYKTSV